MEGEGGGGRGACSGLLFEVMIFPRVQTFQFAYSVHT